MNHDAIGVVSEAELLTWTALDVILYALGVGAGQDDAGAELQLTTENTAGVELQVLPTFAIVAGRGRSSLPLGNFPPEALLHGDQSLVVHQPLPVEGTAEATTVIDGIYDMGSGALAVVRTLLADPATQRPLVESTMGLFVRGEGGFGGLRPPRTPWELPDIEPDLVASASVRQDQALLYRLSGDVNPLHSDPAFAAAAGFDRPILHGLCTYGITARLLVHAVCDGDPTRLTSIEARFTKPVLPGDGLTLQAWRIDGAVHFQTVDGAGDVVLDRGRCAIGPGGTGD